VDPVKASELLALAMQYHQAGDLPGAELLYRQVLAADPANAVALQYMGVLAKQRGNHQLALDYMRQSLRIQPQDAACHCNLGLVYKGLGQLDEAVASFRQALQLWPEFAEAYCNLGNTLRDLGRLEESIASFNEALRLRPNFAEAYCNLGVARRDQGRLDEAVASFRQALRLRADLADAHFGLGTALLDQHQMAAAVASLRESLHLRPNFPEAHCNLGIALHELGKHEEAIACYRHALRLRPDYPEAHHNLATDLQDQGCLGEAVGHYRNALRLKPDYAHSHSGLLFCLSHNADLTPDELFAEHQRWGELHGTIPSPLAPHNNDRHPNRRLRVGYVSPDFFDHAVTRFIEPVLANHDPAVVEIFCYAEMPVPDAVTERLRSLVHTWRWTRRLSDARVAELIRADRIDILVDLAGHTSKHRLRVFAYKPAPIQVTWIGYPHTTGLRTMDYRLTDAVMDPPGEPKRDTEELVRLPRGLCCFAEPVQAPDVGPLPALRNGYATLGSLHKLSKINAAVLDVWCRILQTLPSARLLVFRDTLVGTARSRLAQQLGERGIGEDRFELRHKAGVGGFLGVFADIDVGLDPFPYTGGTISCESLWMGVPFVSLLGDRPAARAGSALLTIVGLPELVAATPEEVVSQTVALAGELNRLSMLRSGLRERMRQTLCDGAGFTRDLEAAYQQMWRTWCARSSG
jgi:predicted O-linked N-acetylglucosamine transferase (SPINDLY family)